jgi:hypothetical protein
MAKRPDLRDVTAEIVRRADGGHVVRVSDPRTASERLQLLAAHLQRRPIVVIPVSCRTVLEWLERYAPSRRG